MIKPNLTLARSLTSTRGALTLALAFLTFATAQAAPPDLTAPGVIAGIDRSETYNLGPTGLRGWIWIDSSNKGDTGLMTDQSRQILVTHCVAPSNTVLAVNDVILGAIAANSGTVPNFTSDCRKAFAAAITDAEKTGAGTLRVKRWRAGSLTNVNIPLTTLGNYTATAPFSCPKSTLILNGVRNKMVADLLADPNYLISGFGGSSNALALLSGVKPGDPNYSQVQTRLQGYARTTASAGPIDVSLSIWGWSYSLIFLAEYYLITGDAQVVPGIQAFTLKLAESQSIYGTYGHGPSALFFDGSGRRLSTGYGPVNSVGGTAAIALVMGKKALVAASQSIDLKIDTAIQRSSDFFSFYANKGGIPYGEHDPVINFHASNGKDAMPAVFFGLQTGRAVETEYFSRLSIAGWIGREYGHTGQGLSYYWTTLGALMGGPDAASEHLKQIRWHLDLSRRTDGSFAYDGQEQYGAGTTSGNTYLGAADYYGMSSNAMYLLTYSLPLQRLWITGKTANPAYTLNSTKIASAVSAGSFRLDRGTKSISELFTAIGDYDPIVRHYASIELASRTLPGTDLTNLRSLLSSADPNFRQGACETLGIRQDSTALPTIVARLNDSDNWVRAKAAIAIRAYSPATASVHRDAMMTSFIANATDPDVINWSDPLQMSNGKLSMAIFGHGVGDGTPGNDIADYTINAPKQTLLYPAMRVGLKQPDSYVRAGATQFCKNRMPLADVQAVYPEAANAAEFDTPADRMWSGSCRADAITTMAALKITEGIPLALLMMESAPGFEWGEGEPRIAALNALVTYGDAARYTLPTLRGYLNQWNPSSGEYPVLVSTIDAIENSITAPAQAPGLCVANSQVVTTTGAKAITLSGTSPRGTFSYLNVTQPAHGSVTGTPPNLTYTPTGGYTGPDKFTFQTTDTLTTSAVATVAVVVGSSGNGVQGDYFNNIDFTSPVLNRIDPQINFDWGTGSPDPSIGADTFSTRWSGVLLVPQTGNYTFSALTSDGVRLYINGNLVIDRFVDQSTKWTDGSPVYLAQGEYAEIFMEYYENTGSAVAKLKWIGPGFAGANGNFIPQAYLFDGSSISNRPVYAFPQNLTTNLNTALPISLGGSGGTLTYAVLTQPASGTLSGTAPYLTYTPNSNFSGNDSFTYLVNDGTENSLPATVSINVQAGPLTTYTWANAVSGNWSDATKWTPSLPAASGQPFYALSFTAPGSYTATHNLNNGFKLNQLNLAANVSLNGSQGMSFVANGGSLPRLNQNGADFVTILHPLSLAAMTAMGGNGSGDLILNGAISGNGGLTKNSPGLIEIGQNNSYSGGTVINAGTLRMADQMDSALGTGPITLNGGTLLAMRINATNPLIANGGKLWADGGWGGSWNGTVTLTGDLSVYTRAYDRVSINGNISGPGGLIAEGDDSPYQSGNGVFLSGTNTYTGKTAISKGMLLRCSSPAALANSPLEISTGARIDLNFSGTKIISSLTLDGAPMPAGTYGSTASPATNKNNTFFSGTGTVTAGAPNSAPVATTQSVSTAEETAKPITLAATDANGNPLTYAIVTYPTYGTLSGTAPNVIYTPALNYNGPDSFTFKANDGIVDSAPATVTITVTAVNDAPFASAQSVNATQGIAKSITLVGADVEGSALTYAIVAQPTNGTLSGTPPNVTYTATVSYSGPDSFTFKVNDGTSDSNIATVSITVSAPPVVNAGPDRTISLKATLWSPLELDPQLWLDANDSSTITLNGSSVNQWNDKSIRNRHATAVGTAQPTATTAGLNGKRVLTFDGSSDVLNVDLDFLAGVSHSAFIVTKPTAFNNIYGAANGDAGANSLHVGFNGSSYRMNYWGNDYGPSLTANFVSGSANIMNYIWTSGTSKQILANGKSEGTDPSAGVVGTMSGGGRIGSAVGQGFFGGDIAELIFITGAVSASDRQNMEGYLAHKWGLAGQLSADHPRKLSPPSGPVVVASLNGSVSDSLASTWTLVSGPAAVTFGSTTALNTTVIFTTAGTYVFRLTTNYSGGSVLDDVTITVNPESPYVAWSGSSGFASDANGDGISNGLAWALGASGPTASATSLLPTIDNTTDPDYFIFTYRRSDAANTDPNTTIAALYGTDLSGWTSAVHDGTNIIITPTDNFYGSSPGVDKVEVKIKRTLAPSGKLFSRLRVNIVP